MERESYFYLFLFHICLRMYQVSVHPTETHFVLIQEETDLFLPLKIKIKSNRIKKH
jgi:hypothetical protein